MKLTSILLLVTMLQVHASSFAQKVTLEKSNSNLIEVLNEIHKQTGYSIFYDAKMIASAKPVTVHLREVTIDEALKQCFENQSFTYKINNQTIVIVPKVQKVTEAPTPSPVVVTGRVTDEKNNPIPGVVVKIKGTPSATVTNADGQYSIDVPTSNAVLVFSFIGYASQEINIGSNTTINVILKTSQIAMSEIVVVGYGTQKKSDLTGAISSVSAKDIEKTTVVDATGALQGRAAGVMVVDNTGQPGSEGTIRIRGIGTVNNNDPLYVVDGTFVSDIAYLSPSDISSIEVLKDAGAAAIYGSRGANGVVLVTTKKGSINQPPTITFNTNFSDSKLSHFDQLLNNTQYLNYIETAFYNGYLRSVPNADPTINPLTTANPYFSYVQSLYGQYKLGYNTNWPNAIFKASPIINSDISIRGGTPTARYSAGAGYYDQKGIIDNSSYKRYTFRINSDYTIKKRLVIGENLGLTVSNTEGALGFNTTATNGVVPLILSSNPLYPLINPNANPNDPNYQYNKFGTDVFGSENPAGLVARINDHNNVLKLVGNAFGELEIVKGLKLRTSFGYDYNYSYAPSFSPQYFISGSDQSPVSTVTVTNTTTLGQVWENTLNYSFNIKKNAISFLAGYTEELYTGNFSTASRQQTPSNDPSQQVFDSATGTINLSGSKTENSLRSYFGRVNYVFDDKYLLTGVLRRDGSSKFAPGNQWGTFPSITGGWRVTNEKFFQDLNISWISSIKLRGGWGEIGNQSMPGGNNNPNLSLVSSNNTYRYVFGNAVSSGDYLTTIGTPSIHWETTAQSNFGADMSFFHDRLSVTADYFVKNTKDILLQVPLPSYAGYPNTPYTNAGGIRNKGFEFSVAYHGTVGKLLYDFSGNISHYDNVVTSLGNGSNPIFANDQSTNITANKTAVGHPVGELYGYVTDGIFQNMAQVQAYKNANGSLIQPNALPGDFKFKDINGDGVINSNDETYIGNPNPKFTYGFTINLQYSNFDFTAFFQGSYGNKLFNVNKAFTSVGTGGTGMLLNAYQEAWHGEGTSNTQPIISTANNNDNYRVSDWYVQDGSYMRLKNLQIGYHLSNGLVKKLGINSARLWIGGTDLFTITKYTGNDPEAGLSANPLFAGREFSAYPKIRKYSVGINVSL